MGKDEKRNDATDDATDTSSRLGKEAKIGVAVIGLLLLGLGVAVTMRLMGSDSDEKVATATDQDAAKEKSHRDGKTDPFKDNHSKPFGAGAPPTVVPAKAASGRPPKTTVSDLDQWKMASDRNDSKHSGSGSSLSAPPLMPDPPKPPRDERSRYSLDPPALKNADDAPPYRNRDSDVRLVVPGGEAASRTAHRGSRADSSGFATAEPAPALPSYGENARRENPPMASYRSGSAYSDKADRSTPAMSVGQFDANDYRRESPSRRHVGGELRRSSASSFSSNPPPRRDDGKYEVQPNDSYWTISERLYGAGAYFKALAQHNRGKGTGEEQLQPGTLILAPTVEELEKSYPDLCPKASRREALQTQSQSRVSNVSARGQFRGGRTYTVAEGDTLFNIARYELGKASRWVEIYELNRDVLGKDFNYLTPGIQLSMPEGEKSDVIAQPPSGTFRR